MELLPLENACSGSLNIGQIGEVVAQATPNHWRRVSSLNCSVEDMADSIEYRGRSLIRLDTFSMFRSSFLPVYRKDETDTEESGDEQGPTIQLYIFRTVPAPLLFAWRFRVRERCFHAIGCSTLSGEILWEETYALEDHTEVTVRDLRELAQKAVVSKNTLLSQNQQIKMYLQGDVKELLDAGLIWNQEASTAPPHKRLRSKIGLQQLRLQRWEDCFRRGLMQLHGEPSLLA